MTSPRSRPDRAHELMLMVLTITSALVMTRDFSDLRWLAPVVLTALITHGSAVALRRTRLSDAIVILIAFAIVALLGVYLVIPTTLSWGLPLGGSWATAGHLAVTGRDQIRDLSTPVAATKAVTILAVWATGTVAIVAEWLSFQIRSPLQGMAPAFSLYLLCASLGESKGRGWTILFEVVALAATLAAARGDVTHRLRWLGRLEPRADPSTVVSGAAALGVSALVAVVVLTSLPSRDGNGALGWNNLQGQGPGAGDRITPSPFDDIRTKLLNQTNSPAMTVTSSRPSYWTLTTLDHFNGSMWSSTDTYDSFSNHLPGMSSQPGVRQVKETFRIEKLNSIWLPTAFNPESVSGVPNLAWDPQSDSLISPKNTSDGDAYTVTSAEVLSSLAPGRLKAVPQLTPALMRDYLGLPNSLPPNILKLAQQITAGQTNEYGKSLALEQYFHTPQFSYSLTPPSDDSAQALETFLFRTRSGYCQQFAGAFAVLARLVGLPTRIAVGFQTGTAGPNGVYQVRGSDAHAWPEVYFPTIGWVPFEPTPQRQIPGAVQYTGITDPLLPAAGPATATPRVVPPPVGTPPRPNASTSVPPTTTLHPALRRTDSSPVGWVIASVVLLVAAWIAFSIWWRRRRQAQRRASAGTDPARRILCAWQETEDQLSSVGLVRRADETATDFASRIKSEPWAAGGEVWGLARLVEYALYSDERPDRAAAVEAEDAARRLEERMRAALSRPRRFAMAVLPRRRTRSPKPSEDGQSDKEKDGLVLDEVIPDLPPGVSDSDFAPVGTGSGHTAGRQ